MWTVSVGQNRTIEDEMYTLTKHVSCFILATKTITNITLNTEVDDCHVINAVLVNIKTTKKRKATTGIDFAAREIQLLRKLLQGKPFPVNQVTIKTQGWSIISASHLILLDLGETYS